MSLSSSVILFRRNVLLQCLIVVLLLAVGCVADAPYGRGPQGMAFDRFAVQNNEYADKGSSRGLVEALDRAGVLAIVKNLVPEIHELLVKMENLFHSLDKDRHRHIDELNRILRHLKDTWARAMAEMMRGGASSIVTVNGFNSFLAKYQELLNKAIHDDDLEDSDVAQFLGQLEHLFRLLESTYAAIYYGLKESGIPFIVDWNLFSQTTKIVDKIPDDLFDEKMLGDMMKTPKEIMSQFAAAFEEYFNQLMGSPVGQYVPLAISMINAATMNSARQRFNENRSEL